MYEWWEDDKAVAGIAYFICVLCKQKGSVGTFHGGRLAHWPSCPPTTAVSAKVS